MESQSAHDFLQVSINTDKLNSFASSLMNALAAQERQLQQHGRQLAQMKIAVEEKISRMNCELDYEKERFDKKRKEDSLFFNSFINDTAGKYEMTAHECRNRLSQLQEMVGKQKPNVFQQKMSVMESQVKTIQTDLRKSISTQDFLLKNVIEAFEKKTKNQMEETKHQTAANSPRQRSMIVEPSVMRQMREKPKRKIPEKCNHENLQYASVSAKLDSLQNRLTAKQNQSLNKVVYAKKLSPVLSEPSEKKIPLSMERMEVDHKNLETSLVNKLDHIEQMIVSKFEGSEKETEKIRGRCDVMADQVQISIRKFEKDRPKLVELALQLKKLEQKKMDDKLLDNFMTIVKKQNRVLEDQLEKKLAKEIWQKDHGRLHEKLQIISQNLHEKADKDQIKRAFQFIEDKIKDIVLLMASDAQIEKQGAGRKLPFKCLSCDKELQNSVPPTNRQQQTVSKGMVRSFTSSIRRRIRAGHGQQK